MKIVYFAAVLLLAGTVSCTPTSPAHKIIDLPEWIPDIDLAEIIATIREIAGQILEILGIDISGIDISLQQLMERLLEALGIDFDEIDLENLTIEELLDILGIQLPDIDWENIDFEEILAIIVERIQEIVSEIAANVNRPVEGTAVSIEDHPSTVQIQIGTGTIWVQGCVATIITNLHVISHSRCFSGVLYDDSRRRVVAGSSERNGAGSFVSGVDFANNNNDISLVRLMNSLPSTDTIQMASIIAPDYIIPPGSSVVTVGWGKTTEGGFVVSSKNLNEISLTVIDTATCAERWSSLSISSEQHICLGRSETGGRDADFRDLGAPTFFNDILVGVHSEGKVFGNQNWPIVSASVSFYTNWIVENAN